MAMLGSDFRCPDVFDTDLCERKRNELTDAERYEVSRTRSRISTCIPLAASSNAWIAARNYFRKWLHLELVYTVQERGGVFDARISIAFADRTVWIEKFAAASGSSKIGAVRYACAIILQWLHRNARNYKMPSEEAKLFDQMVDYAAGVLWRPPQ